MRYYLTNLINTLSKEEIRNFKIFNSRFKYQGEAKKVIRLFDLIKGGSIGEYEDKIVAEFYPNNSRNAFYRLKNRLVSDIEGSMVQLNQRKDEESDVYYQLILAKSFYRKSDFEKVFHYLKKAEKIAKESNQYNLLNIIYDKFIHLAKYYKAVDIGMYIEKSKENMHIQLQTQKNNLLINAVTYKLRKSNFSSKDDSLVASLNEVITQLEIDSEELQAPILKLQLHRCIRGILLEKRDFPSLSDYLVKSYYEFKESNFFTKEFHEDKLTLLSWIINALPRCGRFSRIVEFINELELSLVEFDRRNFDNYFWVLFQTKVIHFTYTNQIPEAIKVLKELEQHPKRTSIPHYTILISLNLTVLYYLSNDLEESLSCLSEMILAPDFNKRESTWKMRITLVEIIVRLDNGDFPYATNRCNEFSRKYKVELRDEAFQREKEFLRILKTIATKPGIIADERFKKRIEAFIDNSPKFEPGSNEAINYKVWLLSKLARKPYYIVMQEIFAQLGENEWLDVKREHLSTDKQD